MMFIIANIVINWLHKGMTINNTGDLKCSTNTPVNVNYLIYLRSIELFHVHSSQQYNLTVIEITENKG